jgi:hypothetical protein
MSQIKVNAVTDASGGNTATINSMTPTADSLQGFRNRIINGDMRIDQRNAGAAVSTSSSYPVDRFYVVEGTSATFTSQRSTTAPTGFTNSLLFTVGTGASAGAAEQVQIRQAIEGFNIADLAWGTANAKSVTISFQVRSSVTGTYCVFLQSSDGGVSYVATYTISAANTFESKSITITGPTSGTFSTDNSTGVLVGWDLGSGSNFNTTAGSWQSGQYRRTTAQANFISNSSATFYITGVQLEVGSVATPFERRPYGTEILLCQRYFQRAGQYATYAGRTDGTTTVRIGIPLNTYLRASPTLSNSGDGFAYSGGARVNASGGSVTANSFTNSTNMAAIVSGFTGLTDDRIYNINFGSGDIFISAEL